MKRKKYLIFVFILIFICTSCTSDEKAKPITSISANGSGAVVIFNEKPMFLLNGLLYTFNETSHELELFCDNENCSHEFSDDLTEPSQCPAALGKGYIIGSFDDELYAAVSGTGWHLYKYSKEEKRFKSLNHILEIIDFEGAFHKDYFYYFSLGSLKRIKLTEGAESEILVEHMAGDEYYKLSDMTFFDDVLLMVGGIVSIDTWVYDMNTNELAEVDIEYATSVYYDGKLYYIWKKDDDTCTLYSYTLDTAEKRALTELSPDVMIQWFSADEDYIYIPIWEDIQLDGHPLSSSLLIYTHDGQFVKEILLNQIENDVMRTEMCSNPDYIFIGNSYSSSSLDQSLHIIEKDALTSGTDIELIPVLP